MRTWACVLAVCTTAGAASADYFTIGLGGVHSFGLRGDDGNATGYGDIAECAKIVGLEWDLCFDARRHSDLSDASIYIGDSSADYGITLNPFWNKNYTGEASSWGEADLVDLGLDFSLGEDGKVFIEVFEKYDDYTDRKDGKWLHGSYIKVYYELMDKPPPLLVPAPQAAFMGAVGLGLVGARRRR